MGDGSVQGEFTPAERDRLLLALERTSNELREQMVELEALRRARAAAESANLIRGEVLALVGRAMRTPADALLGLAGLLRMGALLPNQRAYVEALQEAAEALRGILNQVNDFSRLESGTLPLEPIPFDLGVMFDDVAKPLAARAAAKGLGFRLLQGSGDALPRRVMGDPGRIRQIIAALVEWEAGRLEHGEITVEAGRAGFAIPGGGLMVSVSDQGPSIPEDLLPTLFEPFGRGDLAAPEDDGLGLPIARQLARLMGGDLAVESGSGQRGGSRFVLRVPLPDLETHSADNSTKWLLSDPLPTTSLPGVLFVVERDPAQRAIWSLIAEAAGYRATGFVTRDEVVAELTQPRRLPVDVVVFSDHDAEGYEELGMHLRGERSGLGAPALIMLPAAGYPGDARRLREAGFRGYLVKPVAPADLRETLEILRRTPRTRWQELFITRHSLAEARQGNGAALTAHGSLE
ncbi:MAG: ATP-binding protein [Gemmatimonadales bacterium]